ncbi:hypothetical protein [Legionella spiritensis]|uniref:hypothetical protein n=1 Tax=Legionella spiritensis TaxID=452 RepID=UPI000F6DFDDD|nr:hypothetical protein [Legionella spiritensis]VEG92274.1 Uncharacterised protein [Legionella spiritensis]
MRKHLQIYLKQILPDVEWEERNPTQFVSPLLTREKVDEAFDRIQTKKQTIGLDLDFIIVESRQVQGQYRVACNVKRELNKHQLDEITQFLNSVYGGLQYGFELHDIAGWGVEESNDGYSITIHGPSEYYIRPNMFQNNNVTTASIRQFIHGTNSASTNADEHPCRQKVLELAKTGVKAEPHKFYTIYYWDKKSIHELYDLMQNHKKTITYGDNIPGRVAEAALNDLPLHPEMRNLIGFFLNRADAGVLAQVNNNSQNVLRQAKAECESVVQPVSLRW